jgi:hypothetical protein
MGFQKQLGNRSIFVGTESQTQCAVAPGKIIANSTIERKTVLLTTSIALAKELPVKADASVY